MCTATVEYSRNKAVVNAVLSVLRMLGAVVTVRSDEPEYSAEIIRKARESEKAHEEGRCVKMNIADLWR